jgi:hypothetical protein
MKPFLTAFLSVAMFLMTAARAMEIRQFDKMAIPDQSAYVGLLVSGAEQVLKGEGRTDLAAQVDHLFTTTEPGDAHTIGSVEFEINLARARAFDADRVLKNPNARRLEVEDAMIVTVKKNGIELPPSFLNVSKDFKPKHTTEKKKN